MTAELGSHQPERKRGQEDARLVGSTVVSAANGREERPSKWASEATRLGFTEYDRRRIQNDPIDGGEPSAQTESSPNLPANNVTDSSFEVPLGYTRL